MNRFNLLKVPFLLSAFLMLQSGNAVTIQQLVTVQDEILLEQRDVNQSFGISATSTGPFAIRTYSNYIPIVFQNNTGLDASQVYVTFQGVDPSVNGGQQFMTFDSNAKGSFVSPSSTLLSANYSYQLSTIPQVQGYPGSYLFYIPLTISGRVYVTLGKPLFVPVSTASPYTVLDPYVTRYTDPNYYTIYDKWEFTFTSSGQSGSNLAWQGNLNSSGVDFFGISSQISFLSYPSGQLLQNFDSTQVNDGPTTFNQTRSSLMTYFVNGLTTANNSASWSKLILPVLSNPYVATSTVTTYLRVLNPGFSIQNPPQTYSGTITFPQNPSSGFPNDYLTNASYGENYVDKWFAYYNGTGRSLSITEDVVTPVVTIAGPATGTSPNQVFTLQPGTFTLLQTATLTTPFFTGAAFAFNPSSGVLSQFCGATFEVGLFNTTTVPSISQANLRANAASYYTNPAFTSTTGPWYDLYASLLHSKGLIPSYSTTNRGAVYASPYDDLLGINSSIAVKNPTDVTTTPNPYVNIVLNGGNTLASITDSGNTTVTFVLSVPSSTISYRTGGSGNYVSVASGTPFAVSSYPLQVKYNSGNSTSVSRYYDIYLKYQNMQPTVVSGNQYNSDDQGIIQTTTIYPGSTNLSSFTITFVQ